MWYVARPAAAALQPLLLLLPFRKPIPDAACLLLYLPQARTDPMLGNTSSEVTPGDKVVKVSASFGSDVWDALNYGQVRLQIDAVQSRSSHGCRVTGAVLGTPFGQQLSSRRTLLRPVGTAWDPPSSGHVCTLGTIVQVVYAIKTRNGQVYLRMQRKYGDMSALEEVRRAAVLDIAALCYRCRHNSCLSQLVAERCKVYSTSMHLRRCGGTASMPKAGDSRWVLAIFAAGTRRLAGWSLVAAMLLKMPHHRRGRMRRRRLRRYTRRSAAAATTALAPRRCRRVWGTAWCGNTSRSAMQARTAAGRCWCL